MKAYLLAALVTAITLAGCDASTSSSGDFDIQENGNIVRLDITYGDYDASFETKGPGESVGTFAYEVDRMIATNSLRRDQAIDYAVYINGNLYSESDLSEKVMTPREDLYEKTQYAAHMRTLVATLAQDYGYTDLTHVGGLTPVSKVAKAAEEGCSDGTCCCTSAPQLKFETCTPPQDCGICDECWSYKKCTGCNP